MEQLTQNHTRSSVKNKEHAGGEAQSSQYARSLIEASLDPLVTISPEGKITDVNEATVKVTGVPREKLVGTDFSDYFTEPEKAREGYQQVFAQGFVTDYPLTIQDNAKLARLLLETGVRMRHVKNLPAMRVAAIQAQLAVADVIAWHA
jgi:PAS domain-containing protein